MTDTHSFADFWNRWRGPKDGRLANQNEGKEEARIQWGLLTKAHKILAHQWGPHFQREFRKANGDDCTMLHCCRYLHHKRFLNYEDEEAEPAGYVLKTGEPGYAEWVAHGQTDRGIMAVPTRYPAEGAE